MSIHICLNLGIFLLAAAYLLDASRNTAPLTTGMRIKRFTALVIALFASGNIVVIAVQYWIAHTNLSVWG